MVAMPKKKYNNTHSKYFKLHDKLRQGKSKMQSNEMFLKQ